MKLKIDRLVIFDITGQFAHFRKYYTNASSLSYGIPPRTVIAGLIAGILGKERDSYYKIFDMENTRIGISLIKKYKKIMQTLNYYNLKMQNYSLRYQVPMEILLPYEDELAYRIYFYNEEHIEELTERLQAKKYIYNPYLGISEFLAGINFISSISKNNIHKLENNSTNRIIEIKSCFKKRYIKNIDFNNTGKMIIERMPINFKENRELHLFDEYIYEEDCNTIKIILMDKTNIYNIEYREKDKIISENIIFME